MQRYAGREIFSGLNTNFHNMVVRIIDWIIWGLLAIPVAYQLFFAICSKFRCSRKHTSEALAGDCKVLVLIPAYMEDAVIEQSVTSIMGQDYPKDKYKVTVIADKFKKETVERLNTYRINVLDMNFDASSKAVALKYAMEHECEVFDIVVILDADNVVDPSFLDDMATAYSQGDQAIQAHRMAKNRNTDIATLDALNEEVSNSILRKGHNVVGMSSALIGSGMGFDFKWFKDNVIHLSSAGEDKELEKLLLKQRVFVRYLPDTDVKDEKVQSGKGFYSQRRRWVSAQFFSMVESIKDFPSALLHGNIDYCDKLLQWIMLPRMLLIGTMALCLVLSILINGVDFIKWCILLGTIIMAFFIATPRYLYNWRLLKALFKIPVIIVMMVLNLFRIKGSRDKFYHTEHKV